MAGKKPQGSGTARRASGRQGSSGRGTATGRQGNARQGSGSQRNGSANQRNGSASQRNTSGNGRAGGANGTAARSATAAKPASAAGPGSAAVARNESGRTRLLRAIWAPFGSMGWLQAATFVISLYGLGASIYLTIAHFDTHIALSCPDKGFVDCEAVTTSPSSELFGHIPVAVLGLAFFVFMVAINSPWGWRQQHPYVKWGRFGSVVVGIVFVMYLVYAELIDVRAICLWCTSVHVATFLIFVLLIFHVAFDYDPAEKTRLP